MHAYYLQSVSIYEQRERERERIEDTFDVFILYFKKYEYRKRHP